jgi:diamine N-acetyltransferase
MIVTLRNREKLIVRLLESSDEENLFQYLLYLSPDSRSRFGPHAFDRETVNAICQHLPGDTRRYIAVQQSSGYVVAYFLLKRGMIEFDQKRYAAHQQFFSTTTTVTFAPSVADAWQSTGLGTAMNNFIEDELKVMGIKHVILWGGVQAANEKAVNYYKKLDYQYIANFWHEGKENYDMVKIL